MVQAKQETNFQADFSSERGTHFPAFNLEVG